MPLVSAFFKLSFMYAGATLAVYLDYAETEWLYHAAAIYALLIAFMSESKLARMAETDKRMLEKLQMIRDKKKKLKSNNDD